ncbi:MAG TPA: DNA mismatch repair endonuclease MutL [Candidatus Barnesiella excrementavium]|nr:DNA mismatch repair endonuclease MutL [Candidatus Barnesiella excrementavium]
MSDIIHLLPDSVANQIAAGEVIQRPASVIKELVENAVDAGATTIQIVLKDAGRTLIQVIDNGKGMSPTDARLAFERHSTSKIRSADDLFTLRTMGFRGEALASIAAIAQVELRTRRSEDEVGTCVRMSASQCEGQESVSTPVGSNFAVKNIFFNVPARRKFLKSNQVELSNILGEFERMALINTQVAFTLTHNDTELFNLPASNLRQRIVALFGKSLNQQLLALDTETSLVKISGYVGRPESARKRGALQYFFVNGRYMRHPYFHKAVTICYEHLVPVGEMPNYFINLTVEPETIDVNIHPTKSEIKFENEQPIWQILSASVKEALGKYSAAPTIDFDMDDAPEIPISKPGSHVAPPTVQVDKSYNPFRPGGGGGGAAAKRPQYDWQQLYSSFNNSPREEEPLRPDAGEEVPSKADFSGDYVSKLSDDTPVENNTIFPEFESKLNQSGRPVLQLKGRYITVPTPDGLMVVDQHRAHGVVLFERFMVGISSREMASQRILFPEMMQLTVSQAAVLRSIWNELIALGFDLADMGQNSYSVNAVPAGVEGVDACDLIGQMIATASEKEHDAKASLQRRIAWTLAEAAAVPVGQTLSKEEMSTLVDDLLALKTPAYTPAGKSVFVVISYDELQKRFN